MFLLEALGDKSVSWPFPVSRDGPRSIGAEGLPPSSKLASARHSPSHVAPL